MHGYRAPHAFDGATILPGGALVLVHDGRIVGLEAADFPAPAGCPVVDLPDATLLPGLVDAHVHLCGDAGPRALDQLPELTDAEVDAVVTASLAAQLSGGVTAVRDLGDARWAVADRHRHRDDGLTVVAAGPPITSPGGHCAGMGGEAVGAEGLRTAVRERVEHGVDVVKIMTSGGMMTAGTDAGIKPAKPHGIMCEHVVELVTAGLPVAAALTAATSTAATACGLRERTGRLAAGLDADLLAVDGNLAADVTALRDVRLVVSRRREVLSAGQ